MIPNAGFKDPAGLAALLLSVNTVLTLEKKGVLTHDETKEIVDQAILNLETHQAKAGPDDAQAFLGARGILEGLLTLISLPSAQR